jgi:hypothetical protein
MLQRGMLKALRCGYAEALTVVDGALKAEAPRCAASAVKASRVRNERRNSCNRWVGVVGGRWERLGRLENSATHPPPPEGGLRPQARGVPRSLPTSCRCKLTASFFLFCVSVLWGQR